VSQPDYPVGTETKQLLAASEAQQEKLDQLTAAVNLLGANVQWIIDNVKGIFEMFSSPAFMQMLPGVMGGVNVGGQGGTDSAGPGDESGTGPEGG
jgi:hypothetical protein